MAWIGANEQQAHPESNGSNGGLGEVRWLENLTKTACAYGEVSVKIPCAQARIDARFLA